MILFQKVKILSNLGNILESISKDEKWPGTKIGINEQEYLDLVELVNTVHIYNGWFTPQAVKRSFAGISSWLDEEKLLDWLDAYPLPVKSTKTVALIMAGNIPLVGFHDFLAVFLSGHKSLIKLSSDDKHLLPALIKIISLFDPSIYESVDIKDFKLANFDAVIATGSDNSANYFQTYFGKYPHLIRKNRTSVALLTGRETNEELVALGSDVFTYFGLGCRNVSQIWLPIDFDINRLFEAFYEYKEVINHNKYANNYDYNKAVYLLNLENLLDNGFLLVKEDEKLNSPLGMLHVKRYESLNEFRVFVKEHEARIQVIVGKNHLPFGQSQTPSLTDYADGVDTLDFLSKL